MSIRYKLAIPLFVLLTCALAGCGSERKKFVAPEIEPPADLIPVYIPKGYKLISGFQIAGEDIFPVNVFGDGAFLGRLRVGNSYSDLRSPNGNDIQGVYYQGKDHLILIARSYFPEGTLDLWREKFEASGFKFDECECFRLRFLPRHFLSRILEILEERTISGTRVLILKGPVGWITVFIRGDYLLTVESGTSLEEIMKIVSSLLKK